MADLREDPPNKPLDGDDTGYSAGWAVAVLWSAGLLASCGRAEMGTDAGGNDAAVVEEATRAESGVCSADNPTHCLDCNGGGFCVSGDCPVTTCPTLDAGVDASVPPDSGLPSCGGCGANQVCAHPGGCGGDIVCHPLTNDGGCADGWTYSPLCEGNPPGPGCLPPPCIPSPFCVTIPAACSAQLTCACLDDAQACFGSGPPGSHCASVQGRDLTCQ